MPSQRQLLHEAFQLVNVAVLNTPCFMDDEGVRMTVRYDTTRADASPSPACYLDVRVNTKPLFTEDTPDVTNLYTSNEFQSLIFSVRGTHDENMLQTESANEAFSKVCDIVINNNTPVVPLCFYFEPLGSSEKPLITMKYLMTRDCRFIESEFKSSVDSDDVSEDPFLNISNISYFV